MEVTILILDYCWWSNYETKFKFGYVRSQRSSFIDIIGGFDLSSNIQMDFNVQFTNYKDGMSPVELVTNTALSIYPQYTASEKMSWGLRLEYIAFDQLLIAMF